MKRFLIVFAVAVFAGFGVQLASADVIKDSLVDAFEKTLTENYSFNETNSFSVSVNSENLISADIKTNGRKDDNNTEMHTDLDLNFNTSPLVDMDSEMIVMDGSVQLGEDVYFEDYTNSVFWKVRDLSLNFNDATDQRTQDIADGIFEMIRFVEDKYVTMDLVEFGNIMETIGGNEMGLSNDFGENLLDLHKNSSEFYMDLINAFLDSGFVDIARNGNTYTITLKDELGDVDIDQMVDLLGSMMGMPTYALEGFKDEFDMSLNDIKSGWGEFLQYIDFRVDVYVISGKVEGVDTNFSINIDDGASININLDSVLDINSSDIGRVSFPSEIRDAIDMTKFFNAIKTIIEMEMEQMSEWSESYGEYGEYNEDDWFAPTPRNSRERGEFIWEKEAV